MLTFFSLHFSCPLFSEHLSVLSNFRSKFSVAAVLTIALASTMPLPRLGRESCSSATAVVPDPVLSLGKLLCSNPSEIHQANVVVLVPSPIVSDLIFFVSLNSHKVSTTEGLPGFARVLLFEFSMPDKPQHNNGGGNKPAVWLLNSRIPNMAQYFDCNCWKSGCGELDVFEVLAPGQDKALSTFHLGDDGKSAGDANYFRRPKGGPITVALVIDATNGGTVSIKNMGASDGARFGASLSAGKVDELKAKSGLVSEYVYPDH